MRFQMGSAAAPCSSKVKKPLSLVSPRPRKFVGHGFVLCSSRGLVPSFKDPFLPASVAIQLLFVVVIQLVDRHHDRGHDVVRVSGNSFVEP